MNITRDVVTDLLPVYFSGEASDDTKLLMEDYFRKNPDFERIARRAATPLDMLRAASPVAPDAEKEKCDLQRTRKEMFRRRLMFGVALVCTVAPFIPVYSEGHWVWMTIRAAPWSAIFYWSFAALFWVGYLKRLQRRTWVFMWAIFTTVFPFVFMFHLLLRGFPTRWSSMWGMWGTACVLWFGAIVFWVQYFRIGTQK